MVHLVKGVLLSNIL